jgi:hypothetical protein
MFAENVEQMKRDYTDKYVVVDATQPELARFRDVVGRVKTVNMSGRALVEFEDYHVNIGWYDIDPEFLKVVDKPPPKEKKVEAKKPAAKAEAKPAAAKPAAPAAKGGKPSVAEMLAAARAGGAVKPGAAAPAAQAKTEAAPTADKPAAPKVDRSKMSVADMLAAARAGGAPGSAPAKPAAKAPAAKPQAKAAPAHEAEEEAPAPAPKAAAPAAKSTEKIDKSKMSIDDMLAWCRQHDAK